MTAEDYPLLAEFMSKCLFQMAAPTFEEAILQWTLSGPAEVRRLLAEIDRTLTTGYADPELAAFIDRYSDYGLQDELAHRTLAYIGDVLRGWLDADGDHTAVRLMS